MTNLNKGFSLGPTRWMGSETSVPSRVTNPAGDRMNYLKVAPNIPTIELIQLLETATESLKSIKYRTSETKWVAKHLMKSFCPTYYLQWVNKLENQVNFLLPLSFNVLSQRQPTKTRDQTEGKRIEPTLYPAEWFLGKTCATIKTLLHPQSGSDATFFT